MKDWRDDARCRGMDLSLFFSDGPGPSYDVARSICAMCPVKQQCLEDVLQWETSGHRYGYYGGMSARERNKYVRMRRVA